MGSEDLGSISEVPMHEDFKKTAMKARNTQSTCPNNPEGRNNYAGV